MIEKFQRALASLNNKKNDESEKGFSLIELIVVVAILGILVAIAIPVFNGLQDKAKENSAAAAASNAATQVASEIAADGTATVPASTDEFSFAWGSSYAGATNVDAVCVTATSISDGTISSTKGPGC